jgi:hypothetical protein
VTDPTILDGKRIFKATNVKKPHPVFLDLAESLSHIDALNYIKIYNDSLCASNHLSTDKKKHPVTTMNEEGIIGVELLIDPDISTVQFYSLASSQKGYGRKIVDAVVRGLPDDWNILVVMYYSGGFWNKMIEQYPRIVIFWIDKTPTVERENY